MPLTRPTVMIQHLEQLVCAAEAQYGLGTFQAINPCIDFGHIVAQQARAAFRERAHYCFESGNGSDLSPSFLKSSPPARLKKRPGDPKGTRSIFA
jgi:hypothetical protein